MSDDIPSTPMSIGAYEAVEIGFSSHIQPYYFSVYQSQKQPSGSFGTFNLVGEGNSSPGPTYYKSGVGSLINTQIKVFGFPDIQTTVSQYDIKAEVIGIKSDGSTDQLGHWIYPAGTPRATCPFDVTLEFTN